MDTIDLGKLLEKGYYVTLGATSSLLEVIQDPIKREENFKMLGRSFDEIAQELAEKGVTTEAEARSYVDSFIAQQVKGSSDTGAAGLTTVTTTARTIEDIVPDNLSDNLADKADKTVKPDRTVKSSLRAEIQELTQELANLRAQLEQLRQS